MSIKRFVFAAAMFACAAGFAEVAVKNNDKIAFLGDSITYYGNNQPGGYVNLVMAGLSANGIKAHKLPAGISGHKSNQMLERLERSVLQHKPQIMLLSCGVNDVWHGAKRGVKLEDYRKNITAIIEKAQAAGIKVCIMTATMITENPGHAYNIKLKGYNDFLRQIAKEKKCMIADLNSDMQKIIADFKKSNPGLQGSLLTNDGVHMNAWGDVMMATGILRAFGFNDAQMQKAQNAWRGKKVQVVKIMFTADMIKKAAKQAAKNKMSIQQYIEFLIDNPPAK